MELEQHTHKSFKVKIISVKFFSPSSAIGDSRQKDLGHMWVPAPARCLKMNIDVACSASHMKTSLGMVVRNDKGGLILAKFVFLHGYLDVCG